MNTKLAANLELLLFHSGTSIWTKIQNTKRTILTSRKIAEDHIEKFSMKKVELIQLNHWIEPLKLVEVQI